MMMASRNHVPDAFTVGDRVRSKWPYDQDWVGTVVSIASTATVVVDSEIVESHDPGDRLVRIRITHGENAGEPYGFLNERLADLEHID